MIRMFFGTPGCGKTTMAVRELVKDETHRYTYCNFECGHPLVCDKFTPDGLGEWTLPEGSLVAIDEASCEWNNRSFKTFPQELIEYLKKHRHRKVDIDLYSQSWDDVDITARRLVEELWYGRKLFLGITVWRRIWKKVDVEKKTDKSQTGQIVDGYKKASILSLITNYVHSWKFCYRWHWYGFFNSWEKITLPVVHYNAVRRHIKAKPLGKVLADFYILLHRKAELLKTKIYCLKYDIDLPEAV